MKNHKSENRLSQNRREGYRAVSLLLGRWFFVGLLFKSNINEAKSPSCFLSTVAAAAARSSFCSWLRVPSISRRSAVVAIAVAVVSAPGESAPLLLLRTKLPPSLEDSQPAKWECGVCDRNLDMLVMRDSCCCAISGYR